MMIELETDRLLLRRGRAFLPSDDDLQIDYGRYVVEFQDPEVTFQQYKDVILLDYYSAKDGNRFGYYTIFPKDGNQWIGHCPFIPRLCSPADVARFRPLATEISQYSIFELELGWAVSIYHRNQGFATEAAQALIRFGFQTLQVPRIVAFTERNNPASIKVMSHLGMYINDQLETDSVVGCVENDTF